MLWHCNKDPPQTRTLLPLLSLLLALCGKPWFLQIISLSRHIWSLTFRNSKMDGDEFGSGSTTSTKIGTTSGCFKPTSYIGSSAYQKFSVRDLWSQLQCPLSRKIWSTNTWFENPFPTSWSTDWLGVNAEGQTLLGFQGQSVDIIFLSFLCTLSCCILTSRFARLAWKQPAKKKISTCKGKTRADSGVKWDILPSDVQECVIGKLPYENVCQLKAVSKPLRDRIEDDSFLSLHDEFSSENVTLTAPYFYISERVWQCAGYDSSLKKWRRLPPLSYLPAFCKPDRDLFKEYLVCMRDGIVCMNVSKSSAEERLIVFNLLTGKWSELPPLKHRRNPVLMHLLVDASKQHYQVVVAGSSRSGDEHLSRITEVFDSRTGEWKRTGDLPGPDYALNDYQTGIYKDGSLFCIAFLDQGFGKGILRYNLNKGTWLKNWTYPIPFSTNSTILQLVESWGEVYLFSEQESERGVEHCVHRVEWDIHGNGHVSGRLSNVVRSKKIGGRSLEIYPEYTCVPYSEHEVCVFNSIDHSGVIYDVRKIGQSQALQAPSAKGFDGECFFSLNPLSFTVEPNFRSKINFEKRKGSEMPNGKHTSASTTEKSMQFLGEQPRQKSAGHDQLSHEEEIGLFTSQDESSHEEETGLLTGQDQRSHEEVGLFRVAGMT